MPTTTPIASGSPAGKPQAAFQRLPSCGLGHSIGPCVKQTVTATIVTQDGRRFVGTNYCRNAQSTCPRAGMATGVGYELCKSVCDQPAHAEVNAIAEAGESAAGAVLYLEGHTYACAPCIAACDAAGIARIVIGAPE